MFCARNVPRKFQNCFEFNKNADSFPAQSAQIHRKNTQISAKARKSGFLKLLRFLHVTNRIKSQLVGMKTVSPASYACFKRTIFKYA